MMTDRPELHLTLLSQALTAIGQVGMTVKWEKIPMPRMDEEDDGILTLLEQEIWRRVQQFWSTGEGGTELRQVAEAIKCLQKREITTIDRLVRRDGWYIEPHWMPRACSSALLAILEAVSPARRRLGVHSMLQSQQIPAEEQIELFIGKRWLVRQPRARRPAAPDLFEGLERFLDRTVYRHRVRDGAVEYSVLVQTGAEAMPTQEADWERLDGRILLFPHDEFPANGEDWPASSPTQKEWWVRVHRVYARGRTQMVEVTYLDHSE